MLAWKPLEQTFKIPVSWDIMTLMCHHCNVQYCSTDPKHVRILTQIAKFIGPTWGPPGSCRPQMGPMLASWTLLSEDIYQTITKHKKTLTACINRGMYWDSDIRSDVFRHPGLPLKLDIYFREYYPKNNHICIKDKIARLRYSKWCVAFCIT